MALMDSGSTGMLIYAADGHLSAVLSLSPRAPSGSQSLERARDMSVASSEYVSYAGTWRLEGERIHHAVQISLVPEVMGQTLTRHVVLSNGLLVLSYSPATGTPRTHRLSWRRADAVAV